MDAFLEAQRRLNLAIRTFNAICASGTPTVADFKELARIGRETSPLLEPLQ